MSELQPPAATPDPSGTTPSDLAELRRLLVGPERRRLKDLGLRLDDPVRRAEDVGRILPQSIRLRASQDDQLSTALLPTVALAVRKFVRQDPQSLAKALFPVMGPAIRKAIADALNGLIQSLNQTLEHSVSGRGLKWRFEAWRTGRPFAEVVLLHSLIYRVEQILLIHRESGLLLQHVVAENITAPDADVISGMLTAIEDFARDSFGGHPESGLDQMRLGDLTVILEHGPEALLAVVIRGTAPESLRPLLQSSLESVHLEQGPSLAAFDGETSRFETCRPLLEECLQAQYEPTSAKPSPALWILLAVVLMALGVWIYSVIDTNRRWSRSLERLGAEPGIVVTNAEKRRGGFIVSGLRDPLAAEPSDVLRENGIDPAAVTARWEPYHAIVPAFVLKRARQVLRAPEGVSLELDGTTLVANGSAEHDWIVETKWLAPVLPGITHFDGRQLVDLDRREMEALAAALETLRIRFPVASTDPREADPLMLEQAGERIRRLDRLAAQFAVAVSVEVIGRADTTGTEETNLRLSEERAEAVRAILAGPGLMQLRFRATGAGSGQPLSRGQTESNREQNRSVTLEVDLANGRLEDESER